MPGDRTSMIWIIDYAGINPSNVMDKGIYVLDEFEFCHMDCTDPGLDKGPR